MSRHHASMSHEVSHLLREVRGLEEDVLQTMHGITIEEDGKVHDSITGRTYNDLNEWANEAVENDFSESFEHIVSGEWDEY